MLTSHMHTHPHPQHPNGNPTNLLLQMHYTWGSIFKAPNGTEVWQFDKRSYTEPKHEKEVRLDDSWRRGGGRRVLPLLLSLLPAAVLVCPSPPCNPRPQPLTALPLTPH